MEQRAESVSKPMGVGDILAGMQIPWVTREEAARLMCRSIKTVDRLRKSGRLRSLDDSGHVRISRISIELYLRRPVTPLADKTGTMVIDTTHYDALLLKARHGEVASEKLKESEALCQKKDEIIKKMREELCRPLSFLTALIGSKRK